MIHLTIKPDVEQSGLDALVPFDDVDLAVAQGDVIQLDNDAKVEVGGLSHGTEAGKPVAVFAFTLPDGKAVIIQTTLALFLSAADALKARHGDPRG